MVTMTDFAIDLAWLEGVSGRSAEAASVSRTTLDALVEIGPKRMGHKDLDKACSEFHEKWDERIRGFTQGVDHIRQAVAAAKASYGATRDRRWRVLHRAERARRARCAGYDHDRSRRPDRACRSGQEPHRAGDGLMSDAKDFPGLGFDPAPGIVPAVDGLLGQVRDAVNLNGRPLADSVNRAAGGRAHVRYTYMFRRIQNLWYFQKADSEATF
ncbi:hypothetical protein [Embleya sp. NPDC059237]|uniref:hypothetical protein n=1 Tax=Embleya sp. NPDC059237 TaxID=3346784 RepID=UPI0036B276CF